MKFNLVLLALLAVSLTHAKDEQKIEQDKSVKEEGAKVVHTKDVEAASKEKESAEDVTSTPEISQELTTQPLVVAEGSMSVKVRCYQCNSATKGQEKCGSSLEKDLESFINDCPALREGTFKNENAIGCRKIIQNVGDDGARYIRECAYTGESEIDGKKRTGNKGISMYYYQCENAGGLPCNSAVSQFAGIVGLVIASILAL